MNKYILFFGLLILTASCKKNDVENGFEMEFERNLEIAAGLTPGLTHNYLISDIPSNFQTYLDVNNTTAEKVVSIQPKFLTLDLLDPGNAEYRYLDKAFLHISAPGLVEVEIGFLEFVPDNTGDRLNFIPNTTDIIDYLSLDQFDIRIALIPEFFPQETTINRLKLVFQVYTQGG